MEFEENENTETQENEISSNHSNEENDSDKETEQVGSFLDRMQTEKRKHTQSIEILHRRRPTKEQLMEAGIIKPSTNALELGVVIEDILQDIKQNDIETEIQRFKDQNRMANHKIKSNSKTKKKKKKKLKHFKEDSFAPAIINDEHGQAWDEPQKFGWDQYKEMKTEEKNHKKTKKNKTVDKTVAVTVTKTVTVAIVDEKKNENIDDGSFRLTANNLQKHNKLYSINGEFVINKFLDLDNDGSKNKTIKTTHAKVNQVEKENDDSKQNKVNKLIKTKTPKLATKTAKLTKTKTPKLVTTKAAKLTKTKTKIAKLSNKKASKKNVIPKLSKKKSTKRNLISTGKSINSKVKKDLKQWMVKNSIWDNRLYSYLILNGILCLEHVGMLKQNKFDRIIRQFRVEQFAKIRDKKARLHIDKILIKFEKSWRKLKKKMKKKKK